MTAVKKTVGTSKRIDWRRDYSSRWLEARQGSPTGSAGEQGQDAVAGEAMEELELLLTMRRIVGRVHVDDDAFRRASSVSTVLELHQGKADRTQLATKPAVLEAAQRRLRRRRSAQSELK